MSQFSKVLWGEGQFLCPQHFQQQDAYHEAKLHEISRLIQPNLWGVRALRFDLNSLNSGILRPTELSVIFPDGEPYSAPHRDELPAPLTLDHLPSGTQETTISLALPLLKDHGKNATDDPADAATRFTVNNNPVTDMFSDAAAADIAFLQKTARLVTSEQSHDAFVTVPLVKIKRTSTGSFALEDTFIPPLIHVSASTQLLSQLRTLLDALQARADALYALFRKPSDGIVEFRSGDMASFWLLHSVNSAYATLTHFYQHPSTPEQLHIELSRVAGAMLSFSTEYRLADLPAYQHETPSLSFNQLFAIIHSQISTVFADNHVPIQLTESKPSYHEAVLDKSLLTADTSFYLAVQADLSAADIAEKIPQRLKIGAPDDVSNIVLSALSGIRLTHASQIPPAIPVKPKSTYFLLEPSGTLYERMLEAGAITIYTPKGIPSLSIELMAITQ